MQIPDELLTVFTAELEDQDGTYIIDVPAQELTIGELEQGGTYRVALISADIEAESEGDAGTETPPDQPQPPVEPGETRYVEIEDLGKQGDGIARVERGYVIIVPGADIGERVKIEVTEVKSNFAVGEILDE